MAVHLGIQDRIRAGDELLGAADVPEGHVRYEGGQRDGVLVERLHVGGFDPVFASHLPYDELRIHHELGGVLP